MANESIPQGKIAPLLTARRAVQFGHALMLAMVAVLPLLPDLAAQEEKKSSGQKPPFKRRDDSTDEELRKQLIAVPEAGFDQAGAAFALATLENAERANALIPLDFGPRLLAQFSQKNKKPEWIALPWQTKEECQLGKETARTTEFLSWAIRGAIRNSVSPNAVRMDAAAFSLSLKLSAEMSNRDLQRPEAVAGFNQMLQIENGDARVVLVEMLAKIPGKEANVALAQRAIYDLSPVVREKAADALRARAKQEYRRALLDGFRSPWPPAADHAAEAVVALAWKDLVPDLVGTLNEPAPALPFAGTAKGDKGVYVREMVRINHHANCLLCHAPFLGGDNGMSGELVRGVIPHPGKQISDAHYGAPEGRTVRADTTFLRQDFSLLQPVENPGKWPAHQRYDYLVRTRKATPKEVKLFQALQKENKLAEPYPQRESVLFALRELTGKDLGKRAEDWLPLLNPIEKKHKGQ